jgi:hypothetical protein
MAKSMAQMADEILSTYGVFDEEGNVQSFPTQSINESVQSPRLPKASSAGVPVHEALPPCTDNARNLFIQSALLAEGKMKDLQIRAEEGDKDAQKKLKNINDPNFRPGQQNGHVSKKTLTKEEIEVLKAARHILQEMTTVGAIGVNMGGPGHTPAPSYSYPGLKKDKKKKKKVQVAEGHVVQGDPMFSKAWNSGIVTKIPDSSTVYFTGKPQKIKRRKK